MDLGTKKLSYDEIFELLGIEDKEIMITKKELMRIANETNNELLNEFFGEQRELKEIVGLYCSVLLGKLTSNVFDNLLA